MRPRLSQSEQALFRSQGGPLSSVPFTCFPTSPLTRFDASLFRVLLLPRLWLPLPPSSRFCRCGRLLDVFSHNRAACAQAGVLGRRGYCPCLPRGGSPCHHKSDGAGFGFVAVAPGGCPPVGGGCRWFATLPWRPGRPGYHVGLTLETGRDATHRVSRGRRCGIDAARRRKERTYPELSGAHGRARLVLACEVGGRWLWRWSSILACASARAFALSLLEGRAAPGHDGPSPTTDEVIGDSRYACFASVMMIPFSFLSLSPKRRKSRAGSGQHGRPSTNSDKS